MIRGVVSLREKAAMRGGDNADKGGGGRVLRIAAAKKTFEMCCFVAIIIVGSRGRIVGWNGGPMMKRNAIKKVKSYQLCMRMAKKRKKKKKKICQYTERALQHK